MSYNLALVTGASSGLGMDLCALLADRGIELIISGRNLDELLKLQAILSIKVPVQFFVVDLSQKQERQKLVALLHERAPDLVINNAGFGLYGDALTYSTEDQMKILEVNAQAVLELSLEAARSMITKGKKGVILNVSSAAAFQIMPKMAVYSSAKAFVNHFSEALDFEVQPYGVRVLSACPGMIDTKFQERAGGYKDKNLNKMSSGFVAKKILKQIEKLQPLLIINWRYQVLTFFSYFLPKNWIAKKMEKNITNRINPRTLIKIS